MNQNYTLKLVNDFAPGYDEYIQNCSWQGPELLFQYMKEYVGPDQRILDLGIGTGLSSLPFAKAGMEIYGIDGSEEMIRICKSKGIAREVKQVNLANPQIPFKFLFDHIISYAVFHFLSDLEPLFHVVSSSLKTNGIFGFSIDQYNPALPDNFIETSKKGVYGRKNPDSGLEVFQHSEGYIHDILYKTGFKLKVNSRILAFKDPQTDRQVFFNLYITQKE